jgi:hypothetical protein
MYQEVLERFCSLVAILYPTTKVILPRERLIKLALRDRRDLEPLAKNVCEAVAKLNQIHRVRKKITTIEASREDMLNGLSLCLPLLNIQNIHQNKEAIKTYEILYLTYGTDVFNYRQVMKELGIAKTTFHNHVNVLLEHKILQVVSKSKRSGYEYRFSLEYLRQVKPKKFIYHKQANYEPILWFT